MCFKKTPKNCDKLIFLEQLFVKVLGLKSSMQQGFQWHAPQWCHESDKSRAQIFIIIKQPN